MDQFISFVSEQWLLVSLLLGFIYAYIFVNDLRSGKKVAPQETIIRLNQGAVLIDLRPSNAYNASHIKGAINIPFAQASALSVWEQYTDKEVILVDQMGQHASSIGVLLNKNGFNVQRMNGGMGQWQSDSLPVVSKE